MVDTTRTSRSPSPSSEEQSVQILVKDPSGETQQLTIPPSTSIGTITSLLINHPSSFKRLPLSSSANLHLTYAGKHLSPESALSDYNLPPQSLLNLTYPLLGGAEVSPTGGDANVAAAAEDKTAKSSGSEGTATAVVSSTEAEAAATKAPAPSSASASTPKKRKFPRCGFKSCTSPIQRIVGDCGFCGGKFCGKHRLLESHSCTGLEECREEEKRRNGERLGRERTVVLKGI